MIGPVGPACPHRAGLISESSQSHPCHYHLVAIPSPADDDANTSRPRLLLVEDDRELAPLLGEVLGDDYDLEHAADGQRGLHLGLTRGYDLVVLDRGLPAIDGLDLLGRLRAKGILTPTLILTARGTLADKVDGLDGGAQDYLTKPFEIDELLARLRALLRRDAETAPIVRLGDRRFDPAQRTISEQGQLTIELSGRESDLLQVLARRPGRTYTRTELLSLAFDPEDTPGMVDTYVYYLRRKLGRTTVQTVHGLGYRIGGS